jgi:hypothetical protein
MGRGTRLVIFLIAFAVFMIFRPVKPQRDYNTSGPMSQAEFEKHMADTAREQSEALKNAKVVINRVATYSGKHEEPLEPGERLISVDVTFSESKGLDLDDVEIMDGDSGENFGDFPKIQLLKADGSIEPNESKWANNHKSLRVKLIYAIPEKVKSIKLHYWGADISPVVPISGAAASPPPKTF